MYPSYNKNMQAHSGHSSSSSSFLAKHPTQTFMYVLVSNEQNLHHTLRLLIRPVTSILIYWILIEWSTSLAAAERDF